MARTPAQIKTSFFNVLYSDAAGSSVRAALGAAASSIVERQKVNAASLPAVPFLAMEWGIAGGSRTGLNQYFPIWYICDSPSYWMSRVEALIPLIKAAYPEDALSMCHLDFLPDRELIIEAFGNVPAKALPFQIRTRG